MEQRVLEPRPEGEPGALSRIVGVFFSPANTFESIARRPGWVLPVVLLLIWAAAVGLIVTPRLDVDAMVDKQIERIESRGGTTLDEAQKDSMRAGMGGFVKWSWVIGVVFLGAALFLVPALYHGAAAAAGKAGRYTAVLSAYAHVQFVQILKGCLLLAVVLPRGKVDPEAMQHLVKSNVGAFMDPETTSKPLLAFLASFDLIDFWAIGLAILALTRVTRLKTATAAAVVLGVWGAWVLISTGFAALGAAFGG